MSDAFLERARMWDEHPEIRRISDTFSRELEKVAEFGPGTSALDFGCGTGQVGLVFAPQSGRMVMVDNSEAMLAVLDEKIQEHGQGNVQVVRGDLETAGNTDGVSGLDVIFSLMALHHIQDTHAVFRAFYDWLKPGGRVVIGELLPEDGNFHGEEQVPHHGFDPKDMSVLFEKCGLQVDTHYEYNIVKKPGGNGILGEYGQFLITARKPG